MVSVPAKLLTVSFLENVNTFQNSFHHPIATTILLLYTEATLVEYFKYREWHILIIYDDLFKQAEAYR